MMNPTTSLKTSPRTLTLELLAIDLSTCSRCTGSLDHVEQAITLLQPVLATTGTVLQFNKILVESEAQAQQLHLVSSPTIRVNGEDILLETTESYCGDCSDIASSQAGTQCRTWVYQGYDYTTAPVGLIVEAILQKIYQANTSISVQAKPMEVPQNLKQFFQNKARKLDNCCGSQAISSPDCGCT